MAADSLMHNLKKEKHRYNDIPYSNNTQWIYQLPKPHDLSSILRITHRPPKNSTDGRSNISNEILVSQNTRKHNWLFLS